MCKNWNKEKKENKFIWFKGNEKKNLWTMVQVFFFFTINKLCFVKFWKIIPVFANFEVGKEQCSSYCIKGVAGRKATG